jgi:hypothetical protein
MTSQNPENLAIASRDKAEILAQALPYIRKFHGKTLVIKYGFAGRFCGRRGAAQIGRHEPGGRARWRATN